MVGGDAAAISPDGRWLVTGGGNTPAEQLLAYDMENDAEPIVVSVDGTVGGLAFSPSGDDLVVTYRRGPGTGALVDTATWTMTRSLASAGTGFLEPAFSRDGNYLIAQTEEASYVWDVTRDDPPVRLAGRSRWAGPGGTVASVDGRQEVTVIDLATRTNAVIPTPGIQPDFALGSPTGSWLAVSSFAAREVRIYDLATGAEMRRFRVDTPSFMAVHPDGDRIAVAGPNADVALLSIRGDAAIELPGHQLGVLGLHISADGETLVTTGQDGVVRVWAIGRAGPAELGTTAADAPRIMNYSISPDGRTMSIPVLDGSSAGVQLVRIADGEVVRRVDGLWTGPWVWPQVSADGSVYGGNLPTAGHPGSIVHSDGTTIELDPCQTVVAFDQMGDRAVVDGVHVCGGDPNPAAPAGSMVIATKTGGTLVDLGLDPVGWAAFGPPDTETAHLVAMQRGGGRIEIWDTDTATRVETVTTPDDIALGVTFSRDGRYVAASTQSGRVLVIDVAHIGDDADNGAIVADFVAHTGPTKAALVADDRIVTTGSGDLLRVWDLESLELLEELPIDAEGHSALAPSDDERTVLYNDTSSTIARHLLSVDDLVDLARDRVQSGWTPARCSLVQGAPSCRRFEHVASG